MKTIVNNSSTRHFGEKNISEMPLSLQSVLSIMDYICSNINGNPNNSWC